MTQDEPPAKRRRSERQSEDTITSEEDKPNRSDIYWFPDGNIILQAEGTIYRIHSFLFARHSEVFKDMFAIPQPSVQAQPEVLEGCPVILLTDKKVDIENLISLIYDGNKTHNFRESLSVTLVASMLRLGRKYGIPYLEQEALSRLHNDYPKSLEEWDSPSLGRISDHSTIDSVVEVIGLAHEFRLHTILPAAYAYYIYLEHLKNMPSAFCTIPEARHHCLIGYSRILAYLKEKMAEALCPPFFLPATLCKINCKTKKWDITKKLPIWATDEEHSFGIFDSWDDSEVTADLCPHCIANTEKFVNQVREEFWDRLPSFFTLPPWEELKDDE